MTKVSVLLVFACILAISYVAPIGSAQGIDERPVPTFDNANASVNSIRPSNPPSVSYFELAKWYSPVLIQDVGCPLCGSGYKYFADYMTRFDYDGDLDTTNNWENLGIDIGSGELVKARRLPAYLYYSVIETETYYFIWYVKYQPADDYYCGDGHIDSHENDSEHMLFIVSKDGTPYGRLLRVELEYHTDWTPPYNTHWDTYYPANGPSTLPGDGTSVFGSCSENNAGQYGCYDGDEFTCNVRDGVGSWELTNFDDCGCGAIRIDYTNPGYHPIVYIEGGGHGLMNCKKGDWPSVRYYYAGTAQDPDEVGWQTNHDQPVGYDLLSVSSEMWEQRRNEVLLTGFRDYSYPGFIPQLNIGGSLNGCNGGDSLPWNMGDRFWIPGEYTGTSTNYIFHPFGYEHLGGDIYNGRQGTTYFINGPYHAVFDINVLPYQTLYITPGKEIRFDPGTKIVANGVIVVNGGFNETTLTNNEGAAGIKIPIGEQRHSLKLKDGGAIWFA